MMYIQGLEIMKLATQKHQRVKKEKKIHQIFLSSQMFRKEPARKKENFRTTITQFQTYIAEETGASPHLHQ